MTCECHDKSHDRPHCGAMTNARYFVEEIHDYFTLCGACFDECAPESLRKAYRKPAGTAAVPIAAAPARRVA